MLQRLLLLSVLLLVFLPLDSHAQQDCSAAPMPRLRSGMTAQVSSGRANNLRESASTEANRLGEILPNSQIQILSDASCVDGYYWYEVDYQGLLGWTAEGAEGSYWLLPVLSDSQIIHPDNIGQLQVLSSLTCPDEESALAFNWSPDGTRLFWGCERAQLYLTDWLSQQTIPLEMPRVLSPGLFSAFSADGTQVIAIDGHIVFYWDVQTGDFLSQASLPGWMSINSRAVYGNLLAIGTLNGVYLFDLLTMEALGSYESESLVYVAALAFSADGRYLAFGGSGNAVLIWTLESDEIFETDVEDWVQSLSFSPSGRYVLAALCKVPNRGDCNSATLDWVDTETGQIGTIWQQENWAYIDDIRFGEDMVLVEVNQGFEVVQISTEAVLYHAGDNFSNVLLSVDGRLLIYGEGHLLQVYGIP